MSFVLLIPAVYLAAVLDAWCAPHWEILGITPDLLALLGLVWLSATWNRYAFCVVGIVGLMSDLNCSAPMGVGMFAFGLTGYLLTFLQHNLKLDGFCARVVMVGFGAALICMLQSIVLKLGAEVSWSWTSLCERAALVGLYTACLAIPLLMLLQWFQTKPQSVKIIDQSFSG